MNCLLNTNRLKHAFQAKQHDDSFCLQDRCLVCMFQGMINDSTDPGINNIQSRFNSKNIQGTFVFFYKNKIK